MLFFLGHDLFYSKCVVQIHGTKVDSNSKYSFIHNGATGSTRKERELYAVRGEAACFWWPIDKEALHAVKGCLASLSASFRARTSSGVCSCSWLCSAAIYSWALGRGPTEADPGLPHGQWVYRRCTWAPTATIAAAGPPLETGLSGAKLDIHIRSMREIYPQTEENNILRTVVRLVFKRASTYFFIRLCKLSVFPESF
jgi:hypothetical protein